MKWICIPFLLLSLNSFAQKQFDVRNISRKYDLRIEVEKVDDKVGRGKTIISIFRKGHSKPFQTLRQKDSAIDLDENNMPVTATVSDKRRGKWSSVYLADFDFDGLEDLAVADGRNGGYGSTSYRVYLYSRARNRFNFSESFTRLAQGPCFGIPEIDRKRKTLETFWKSGSGFHEIQRYKIIGRRPVKVYEYSDSTMSGNGIRYVTTKKLVRGKWRMSTKFLKDKN